MSSTFRAPDDLVRRCKPVDLDRAFESNMPLKSKSSAAGLTGPV